MTAGQLEEAEVGMSSLLGGGGVRAQGSKGAQEFMQSLCFATLNGSLYSNLN